MAVLSLTGTFLGFQRKPWVDDDGVEQVSRRLKVAFVDEVNSVDGEDATLEHYYRIPQDVEIPVLKPYTPITVFFQLEQDKAHENWRVRLVSVSKA